MIAFSVERWMGMLVKTKLGVLIFLFLLAQFATAQIAAPFNQYPTVEDSSAFKIAVLKLIDSTYSLNISAEQSKVSLYKQLSIQGKANKTYVVELSQQNANETPAPTYQFYFDEAGKFVAKTELQFFEFLEMEGFSGSLMGGVLWRDDPQEYGVFEFDGDRLLNLLCSLEQGRFEELSKIYDKVADDDLNEPSLLQLEVLDENRDGWEDVVFSGMKLMKDTLIDAEEYVIQVPVKYVFLGNSDKTFNQKNNYHQQLCREYAYQKSSRYHHRLHMKNDHLHIDFWGAAEEVSFAFYQGPSFKMTKGDQEEQTGWTHFSTNLDLPKAKSANFQYTFEILANKASGGLEKRLYRPEDLKKFRWSGMESLKGGIPDQLFGELRDTLLSSEYLGEERQVSVYLPPNYQVIDFDYGPLPVIYITDGKMLESFIGRIDRLIASRKMHPIVVVGVYAGTKEVEEVRPGFFLRSRQFEYVDNGLDRGYFQRHQQFFLKEAIPFAESTYYISKEAKDRYLFGSSNGGAFCVQTGITHPELWKEIIAFSTVDYINEAFKKIEFVDGEYPSFYLTAGRFEEKILADNLRFVDRLKKEQIKVKFQELLSAHDSFAWEMELLEYLSQKFGRDR